ncbi:MAG: hypothetical protein RL032_2162 [Pseudomonadota bacterium]|jgi:hypothetical protein
MTPEERTQFAAEIVAALKADDSCLNKDEQQWVRLAIAKQEQSIRLRQAVIEKTFAGLVWAGIVGVGAVFLDYLKGHGFK